MDSPASRIAEATTARVQGTWFRHVSARHASSALEGRRAFGRWGTEAGYPVLYLGRPVDSVVVEAYRHLVDPVDDPDIAKAIAPRAMVTAEVDVSNVLDLRTAGNRMTVGIDTATLTSPTRDRESYRLCQELSAVAHQLGLHGLVAPAASEMGETLVLFVNNLPADQLPIRVGEDEHWSALPPDPRNPVRRHLRLVADED